MPKNERDLTECPLEKLEPKKLLIKIPHKSQWRGTITAFIDHEIAEAIRSQRNTVHRTPFEGIWYLRVAVKARINTFTAI